MFCCHLLRSDVLQTLTLCFCPQGPKGNSWRAASVPSTWFTPPRGRSLLWAAACAETLTPSKLRTENQFLYCDWWLLLTLGPQPRLLIGRVSQVSALTPRVPGSALPPTPGSGLRPGAAAPSGSEQIKKNNRNLKRRKKKIIVTCLHAAVVFPRLL